MFPVRKTGSVILAALLFGSLSLIAEAAQNEPAGHRPHAGMLRYPGLSASRIAFVYSGKVWTVAREGGMAVPAANPPGGTALFPRFSSDGKTLAYNANYDGNLDIYTIPVDGGVPVRVTYHPSADLLCGWTPDGRLLYSNDGLSGTGRLSKLLTISAKGGQSSVLPVPYGNDGAISPDGKLLAYTPSSTNFRTWKRYRGGWAQDIWLYDLTTHSAKKITDWEGTDTLPMWHGKQIYYLSDGGPEHRLNIWVYDTENGKRHQVTKFSDYDVKWPSIGPGAHGEGEIVFQHGADLQLLNLEKGATHPVEVTIPGDALNIRPTTLDAARFNVDSSISPTAKRVLVEARGDIWSLPAKEGSPRNLTHTSDAHEKDALWSPDGRWIAYLSDKTGEYEVYILQSDGKGESRQLTHDGTAYRYLREWSPDGKWLVVSEKNGDLKLYNVADGHVERVDIDPTANITSFSWTPDSRYLAYERREDPRDNSVIWVYELESKTKHAITSGHTPDSTPCFDRKGEFLYYSSNRAYTSPIYDATGTSWVYTGTQVLIAVPLRKDIASPYNPKSDEESWKDEKPAVDGAKPKSAVLELSAVRSDVDVSLLANPGIAAQVPDDGISGEWNGKATSSPAGELTIHLKLTMKPGGDITGTLEVERYGNGTLSGHYNAATKELTLAIQVPNVPPITLSGNIVNGVLHASGSVAGSKVEFTATRTAPQTGTPTSAAPAPVAPLKVRIDYNGIEARSFALPIRQGSFGELAVNAQNQLLFVRNGSPGTEGMAGIRLFDIRDTKKEEKSVLSGVGSFSLTPDGSKLLAKLGGGLAILASSAGAAPEPVAVTGLSVEVDPRKEWKQIFTEAWRIQRDFFYDPNMHGVNWKAVYQQYLKMIDDCGSREDVGYVISEMISELNVGHAYYSGADLPPSPRVPVGMPGAEFSLENGAYRITSIVRGASWDTDAVNPLSQPGIDVKVGDYLLAVNFVPVDTKKDVYAAFQGLADKVVTLTVSSKPTADSTSRDVTVQLPGSDYNLRYRSWIEKHRAYVDKISGGRVGYVYVPDTGVGGQNDLVRQFLPQINKEALIIDERWNGGGQIPDRFIELLNRPLTNYWALRDSKDMIWPPVSHQGPKCMLINGLSGSGGDAFPWYFREAKLGKLIGTRTWGGLVGLSGNPGLIDAASTMVPNFAFYKPNGTWGIEGHGVDPDIMVLDDPSKMLNDADPQLDAAIQEMLDELKRHPFTPPKRPAYPDRSKMGIPERDR